MNGRIKSVAVSSVSVELVAESETRSAVTFSVGDAAHSSSIMLTDQTEASATNGFPLIFGSILRIEGEMARHSFFAIRLAAVDCRVGVIEEYESPPVRGAYPVN